MADPKDKRDWTPVLWIIGLIFICGMTYQTIEGMDGRVTVNTSGIKDNADAIHKEEVSRISMQGDIKSTRDDVTEIKGDFKELKNYLMDYDFKRKGE